LCLLDYSGEEERATIDASSGLGDEPRGREAEAAKNAEVEARAKAWNDATWARIEERKKEEARKRWEEENQDWMALQELKARLAALEQVNEGGSLAFDNAKRLTAFVNGYLQDELLPAGSAEAELRASRAKVAADARAEEEAASAKREMDAVEAEKARVGELYQRREEEARMIMKNLQQNAEGTALATAAGTRGSAPPVQLDEIDREKLVEKVLVREYKPIFVPTDYRYVSTRLGIEEKGDDGDGGGE
jgi:hypothetical protein